MGRIVFVIAWLCIAATCFAAKKTLSRIARDAFFRNAYSVSDRGLSISVSLIMGLCLAVAAAGIVL